MIYRLIYISGITVTPVDEEEFQIFAPNQNAMDEAKEIINNFLVDKVSHNEYMIRIQGYDIWYLAIKMNVMAYL